MKVEDHTKMAHQNPVEFGEERAPSQLQELEHNKNRQPENVVDVAGSTSGLETCQYNHHNDVTNINELGSSLDGQRGSSSSAPVVVVVEDDDDVIKEGIMRAEDDRLLMEEEDEDEEGNGRERLKRHRVEVAGRVWIPEIWGQEELLKDWIDCSAFDAALVPGGIMSARAALVEEGRRANSGRFRIENRQCNDESGKNLFSFQK